MTVTVRAPLPFSSLPLALPDAYCPAAPASRARAGENDLVLDGGSDSEGEEGDSDAEGEEEEEEDGDDGNEAVKNALAAAFGKPSGAAKPAGSKPKKQ